MMYIYAITYMETFGSSSNLPKILHKQTIKCKQYQSEIIKLSLKQKRNITRTPLRKNVHFKFTEKKTPYNENTN